MTDYTFSDFVELLELSDYQILLNQVQSILDSELFVISLYTIGSIKAPGISDLDVLVVVKESTPFHIVKSLKDKAKGISSLLDLIIVPVSVFRNIHYYMYVPDLTYLKGEIFEFNFPNPRDQEIRDITLVFSSLVVRQFYFLKCRNLSHIKIKQLLRNLNSFGYTCLILQDLIGVSDDVLNQFVDKVTELRFSWINQTDSQDRLCLKLVSLLEQTDYIGACLKNMLDKVSCQFTGGLNDHQTRLLSVYSSHFIIFCNNYKRNCLQRFFSLFRCQSLVMPLSSFYFLFRYSGGTLFHKYLLSETRQALPTNLEVNKNLHFSLAEEHFQFLSQGEQVLGGAFSLGTILRPRIQSFFRRWFNAGLKKCVLLSS